MCFTNYGKIIHDTLDLNISDSGYYQPLRKYIPRNPDAVSRSIIRASMSMIRGVGKAPSVPPLRWRGGGKSRRKLKTTNKRTNRRTNRRRNTRINRRTNRRRNTRINITKRRN